MSEPTKTPEEKLAEAKKKAVDNELEQLIRWYMAVHPLNRLPTHIERNPKAYNGIVEYTLEPEIPNVTNPKLVERYLGDQWTLAILPRR